MKTRSYKAEVQTTDSRNEWNSNALRFGTYAEAERYGRDLMMRWFAVTDTRVTESEDWPTDAIDLDTGRQHKIPVPPKRIAMVTGGLGATLEAVRNYLPDNYTAEETADGKIAITGRDDHGWTLDGYVIPRLASALIAAAEVSL